MALGKFDAMHTGHRSLVQRATSLGGPTFLLSFWGMAGVLGWEDRLPVGECAHALQYNDTHVQHSVQHTAVPWVESQDRAHRSGEKDKGGTLRHS